MQEEKSATGFAVIQDRKLLPRTVCETKRGAQVNWLVTYAGVRVLDSASDEGIHRAFMELAITKRAFLYEVEVKPMLLVPMV